MPPPETRGRTSRQYSAPCGRVVPIGGQVEPSAQLRLSPLACNPAPPAGGRAHRSILFSVGPTSYDY
jgi:hypothetical protein